MTYKDTINWMFSQLPMYQRQGKTAYKKDLTNTLLLVNHLGNPHDKFKSVHVAGTNGKGSTSHMIASVLQEADYKVGLYTSPHLKDFRERIKINGKEVSKQFVISFISQNKTFFEKNKLSFFEMTVGMAFDYFARQKVDIAIIEVGLGGRLDSTNVITPEISVITNIGFDHMQFLGNTYEEIAKEKAGIIKFEIPVVVGETQDETQDIFIETARKNKSGIEFSDINSEINFETDLKGNYQIKNVKTAVQSILTLQQRGFKVSEEQMISGLKNTIKNTQLLGRWQILKNRPKVVCDTAHNKEGLVYTIKQAISESLNTLHFVLGFVNDKNIDDLVHLFPENATYYFCKPDSLRGLNEKELAKKFNNENRLGKYYNSCIAAYQAALNHAESEDFIYVGGSTFVVAEII